MPTRPAPSRTVARWPFVAGDIVLIAIAVTALLAGGVPPGLGNIVTALISAALGAGLLLVPFLLDYEARVRIAEASARDAAGGQFRRLAQTSEQLSNVVSRSQATEEQAGQVLGSLEELSERLAAQSEELSQMLARVADGQHMLSKPDAERLAAQTGARLDVLAAAVARLQQRFEGLVEKTVADLAAADRSVHGMDERPQPAPDQEDGFSRTHVERAAAGFEPAAESGAPEPEVPNEPVKPTPKRRSSPVASAARKPADANGALELALEEPAREKRTGPARKVGAAATSLVATAYIGIGNKLYLRGEGSGLSWERGVSMEFLAIGKWGWKTADAEDPITCRIFRNDDTPMLDPDIVIAPGEKKEVTPRF